MTETRCYVCDELVTFTTGALGYNLLTDPVSWDIGHYGCMPDMRYGVEFTRLVRDGLLGPDGWLTHLNGKRWFDCPAERALRDAYLLASALDAPQRPAPGQRSVLEMIPRRRPRTPPNPRSISAALRSRVLERDGFRCRRCGAGPDAGLTVDHVVPVAKGGTAAYENLQILCTLCNAGKSDRDPTPHDLARI